MNLSINVQHKLASLLRRNEPFYALSYSWKDRQIVIHANQQNYFEQIINLRDMGMAKRSQCYLAQFVEFGGVQYAIYLVSYGDIRKWKMIYGENPIALNFNVCMFDYVFLFLETKQFANKKIQIRIKQLANLQKWHQCANMRKSAESLFGGISEKENNSCTDIQHHSIEMKDEMEEHSAP